MWRSPEDNSSLSPIVAAWSGSNVSLTNLSNKLVFERQVKGVDSSHAKQSAYALSVAYLDFPVPLSPIMRTFRLTLSMVRNTNIFAYLSIIQRG